ISGADIAFMTDKYHTKPSVKDERYYDDEIARKKLCEHFGVNVLDGLGLKDYPEGVTAAGALLMYLYDTQKSGLKHLTHIRPYEAGSYMVIDSQTMRNLELTETIREKQKKGSLLWVLDKTRTAMGARLLRSYIARPLIEKEEIDARLDAITEINSRMIDREELREYLDPIYDLERLMGRISLKTAGPRDLLAFKNSIAMIKPIKYIVGTYDSKELKEICNDMDELTDLCELLEDSIDEDAPLGIREGGIIKDGYSPDVDEYRMARTDSKTLLSQIEEKEKENTGIKNLRIKYNKVFGYYLEVTNSYLDMVPQEWIRKQTLTNAERFITPELKELEEKILGAQDKLYVLEYELFCEIRDRISDNVERVQRTAHAIARTDVFTSLAYVCEKNDYVRPNINTKGVINIAGGRHPVVERMINAHMFVPNDTYLDNDANRIAIITGPNMAGKSTYMRQTALIVLMAQMGCFVPANTADIGIVDRIFTRVGASDDLASGQSTFMVEMTEVSNILRNSTKNSLLILDEIGRGTSTYDGLSIAWSVVEHINDDNKIGAKTMFATHYHELTELEGKLKHVTNYCVAVREHDDEIVFLRKIIKGGADRSYGIQVAKLAGVPDDVTERAKEILKTLVDSAKEGSRPDVSGLYTQEEPEGKVFKKHVREGELIGQMSLFGEDDPIMLTSAFDGIINEIRNKDINNMTPVECLNYLVKLQKRIKKKS
ncbi:MAG: DNA mismatch repair protein MutS, partial [Lachnospiraceae bacterium]|nr:DNA mismatch repair protein MutS [Lachnospiraceae bacterium]